MIVPVTPSGEAILIQEPTAYGDDHRTLFLPGGSIEPEEEIAAAAHRELQEEIGFDAARLEFLGQVRAWAKYMDAGINLFLARDLSPSRLQGDETYPIVQEYVSLASFEQWIASGRLLDASTISGLFLARQWLAKHP